MFSLQNLIFYLRRIKVCVPHRRMLEKLLSDPASTILTKLDDNQNTNSTLPSANNNDEEAKDFEQIILYQMTLSKMSEVFTSKVIELTVVEDSLFSKISGLFVMIDLGTNSPDNHLLKELMKKFRFGTVWCLRNPDFRIENGDEKSMYIRYENCKVSLHCFLFFFVWFRIAGNYYFFFQF